MEGKTSETVIVLNEHSRWAEVILNNGAHFIISFPIDRYDTEKGLAYVYIRRICQGGVKISKNGIINLDDAECSLDFPFVKKYEVYAKNEPPVDVYIQATKAFIKKITFTYYNEDSQN